MLCVCARVCTVQGHDYPGSEQLRQELIDTVRRVIGAIATPDVIHWVGWWGACACFFEAFSIVALKQAGPGLTAGAGVWCCQLHCRVCSRDQFGDKTIIVGIVVSAPLIPLRALPVAP